MEEEPDLQQVLLDINSKLGKTLDLESKIDKAIRDIAQLQKSVDTLYDDRSILEKIEISLNEFRQKLDFSLSNHTKSLKDVHNEIVDQTETVSNRVDKVKDAIVESVEKKKDVIVIKETFWTRFFGRRFNKESKRVVNSNKNGGEHK